MHDKLCPPSMLETKLRAEFERYSKWASDDLGHEMEQLGQPLSRDAKGILTYDGVTMKTPQ